AAETATLVAILVFTLLATRQAALWQNNETLYRHTLAITKNNHLIDHNLCHYYMTLDRIDEAEPLCQEAVEIKSQYTEAFNTLGVVQFKQHRYPEAEQNFRKAVELAPTYVNGWLNLSQSLSLQGRADEAEESMQKATEANGGEMSEVFCSSLSDLA